MKTPSFMLVPWVHVNKPRVLTLTSIRLTKQTPSPLFIYFPGIVVEQAISSYINPDSLKIPIRSALDGKRGSYIYIPGYD